MLEGPDGSGSTKHASILADRMQQEGHPCLHTAEPSTGKIGTNIRTILFEKPLPPPDALQLLYCADRAEHTQLVIMPALAEGTHVLGERYSLSTELYGAAAGSNQQWLHQINSHFLTPDITIILLPPFEVCKERLSRRTERDGLEDFSFQQKVHALYVTATGPNTVFIDSSGSIEATATEIWQHVEPLFNA